MPAGNHDSRLKAVLSFYDSVVSVTPEGDSLVSDETLEGLGADGSISGSVLYTLFGSLVRVAASSPPPATTAPGSPPISSGDDITTQSSKIEPASKRSMDAVGIAENDGDCSSRVEQGTAKRRRLATTRPSSCPPQAGIDAEGEDQEQGKTLIGTQKTPKTFTLTDFAPDPGYFVAGAIAGGVSRTATAPLDRLKVYLLVNTRNNCESAVGAGNKGGPVPGAGNAPRPIRDAVRDLFRNGGIRSFFAGR